MGMTDAEVVKQLRLEAGYSEYSDEELAAACLRGAEAIEEVARLRAALEPFARYAEMREAKPLRGLDDVIHAIHTGSEWEAELRLSHCIKARAALSGERKGE
jgi:hypothetical protein